MPPTGTSMIRSPVAIPAARSRRARIVGGGASYGTSPASRGPRFINLPEHRFFQFHSTLITWSTWSPARCVLMPLRNAPLTSQFARCRVRPAHDDARRSEPAPEEWLLVEWPEGDAEPDHYWLCTLPADISLERMVDQAKMRWRIERDYLELKQEVGLGHYEGRGWRGFHHHATLCVAAYGFLISEKETIPPSGHPRDWRRTQSSLPASYRPRGAAAAFATPHAELNRNIAYPLGADFGAGSATMSLLRTDAAAVGQAE